MTTAKNQLTKQIAKLEKSHEAIMKKYYRTVNDENRWGDSDLWREADTVAKRMHLLIKALELIEKYESDEI